MKNTRYLFLVSTGEFDFGGIAEFNRRLKTILESGGTVKIVYTGKFHEETFFWRIYRIISCFIEFIKSYHFFRPTVIVFGHIGQLLPYYLPLSLITRGFVSILIIHGIDAWSRRIPKSISHRHIRQIWSVSRFTADRFIAQNQHLASVVRIISNSIEVPKRIPRAADPRKNGQLEVTFIGRLTKTERYKGLEQLMLALSHKLHNFKVRLNVIAHGDDLDYYKDLQDLGGFDVRWFVNSGDEQKKLVLGCSHVVYLAGWGEGFGITLLEGAIEGAVPIGSSLDATREVIETSRAGLHCNPHDYLSILGALRHVYLNYSSMDLEGVRCYSSESLRTTIRKHIDDLHK